MKDTASPNDASPSYASPGAVTRAWCGAISRPFTFARAWNLERLILSIVFFELNVLLLHDLVAELAVLKLSKTL
jgi:hypothetical protein